MKFTVEVLSGLCNVLKSLVTALSMTELGNTNILPRYNHWFDADYTEILDDLDIMTLPLTQAGLTLVKRKKDNRVNNFI